MKRPRTKATGPTIHWVAVFAYAALIFILSSRSFGRPPHFYYKYEVDKIVHFVEFGIFAVLLCRAVRRTTVASTLVVALIAVAIASGYALSDELHQRYVAGRFSDAKDVASDVAGSAAGAVLWSWLTAMRRERRAAEGEEVDECSPT